MVELEPVVVAGTSASEAARGGGLKVQVSVKHRLRTAGGQPSAVAGGVCRLPLRRQCHAASAADRSRARGTAPRDGNERDGDTSDERDLAGVVAGGPQPPDRRTRGAVAHPRAAERHDDGR